MVNRYRGSCVDCGATVLPGEGTAFRRRGARRFSVRHADCETGSVSVRRGRCEDAPCCGHSECGFGPGSPGYGSYVGGSPYYGEDDRFYNRF